MKRVLLLALLSTSIFASNLYELKVLGNVNYGEISLKEERLYNKNTLIYRNKHGNVLIGGASITGYKRIDLGKGYDINVGVWVESGIGKVISLNKAKEQLGRDKDTYEKSKEYLEKNKNRNNEHSKRLSEEYIKSYERSYVEFGYVNPYINRIC